MVSPNPTAATKDVYADAPPTNEPTIATAIPVLATATPVAATTIPPSPTYALLPRKAYIDPIYGHHQLLPLDCEARAAVDWAAFVQKSIDELEFFHRLPSADNPDRGFVGDVNDYWGRLPPYGYGVYAGPVAKALRSYGLSAFAYRGLTYDQLRRQIAVGRPVIVWVIGHIGISKPEQMDLGGESVVVAPYEHAVILIGYEYQKTIVLDGSRRSPVWEIDFRNSWKILGNMAVVAVPLAADGDAVMPFENLDP